MLGDEGFQVITISIDENVGLVEQFMENRMDLPFVNWFVGEQSKLYDDWAIQGVPTYIVWLTGRGWCAAGRTMSSPLYDVILEATEGR